MKWFSIAGAIKDQLEAEEMTMHMINHAHRLYKRGSPQWLAQLEWVERSHMQEIASLQSFL